MNGQMSAIPRTATPFFPLSLTHPGERVRIVEIGGGKKLQERLRLMGINQGDTIHVEHCQAQGAVIVSMGSKRFGLGGGMAMKIFVVKEQGS